MKFLLSTLIFLLISNAHANIQSTKCTNSDGSVKWETGQEKNKIDLKYSNFIEGILVLDIEQVKIQYLNELTLDEKSFKNCHYSVLSKVYAGKIKITASPKDPDVLRSQFPLNKIETEVICTKMETRSLKCEQAN
jgi:hypothetical protein